jgi:quercetin dioxygenase-like cupin family protein
MPSLARIASALGSSQVELMAGAGDLDLPDAPPARVSVVHAHEGMQGPFGDGQARVLSHGDLPFLPMAFCAANTTFGEFYAHAEDEFLHVTEGVAEIDLADEGVHRLEPGDSLHYAGGTPHRWRSGDGGTYRMLVVKERRRT